MTATQLAPLPIQKFWDNNGNPLAGGLLYTYVAGTTTPAATYTDSTGGSTNTNPVVLNFRGEAQIWLNQTAGYKFNLTDSNGNQIPGWPVDNITSGIGLSSLTQSVLGQILYPQSSAEAVASVIPSAFYFYVTEPRTDPRRYGAVGDGVTDDTAALNRALSVGRGLALPSGYTFATTGNLALATSGQDIVGPGGLILLSGTNPLLVVTGNGTAINQVSMNCSANAASSKHAVRIQGTAADVEISECEITQGCIITLGTNSRIRLKRNQMSGACTGGVAGGTISIAASGSCTEYTTDSNYITGSDGAGIAVENFATQGKLLNDTCNGNAGEGINMQQAGYFTISGAECNNNGLVGIGIYTAGGTDSQRALVSNCRCLNNAYDGFDLVASTTTPVSNYLQLDNCYAAGNGSASGATGYNVEYTSNSLFTGCVALGNTIEGFNVQGGILNTFVNCQAIANGGLSPGTYHGFLLVDCIYCTFDGCVSTNYSGSAAQAYGIYERGVADYNIIRSQQCYDNATGQMHIVGAHTVYDLQPVTANVQTLTNGTTIDNDPTNGFAVVRTANSGAVTGIVMPVGSYASQQCTVTNEGSGSITMAASGSNVAAGSGCVIAAGTQKTFVWNSNNLWYNS